MKALSSAVVCPGSLCGARRLRARWTDAGRNLGIDPLVFGPSLLPEEEDESLVDNGLFVVLDDESLEDLTNSGWSRMYFLFCFAFFLGFRSRRSLAFLDFFFLSELNLGMVFRVGVGEDVGFSFVSSPS